MEGRTGNNPRWGWLGPACETIKLHADHSTRSYGLNPHSPPPLLLIPLQRTAGTGQLLTQSRVLTVANIRLLAKAQRKRKLVLHPAGKPGKRQVKQYRKQQRVAQDVQCRNDQHGGSIFLWLRAIWSMFMNTLMNTIVVGHTQTKIMRSKYQFFIGQPDQIL